MIEAIQARYRSRLPINAQAVQSDDSRLVAAGRRLFGSWTAALLAARVPIPPRRGYSRHPRGFWTRDRIITAIRRHAQSGDPLYAAAMQRQNNPLVAAATYHFGSWAAALRRAGFDPERIRKKPRWCPARILEEIRNLAALGVDLSDGAMRRHHRALYSAAQSYYGSWRVARAQADAAPSDTIKASCPKKIDKRS